MPTTVNVQTVEQIRDRGEISSYYMKTQTVIF